MSNERWKGVSRSKPCPVCGKPDWCGVAADGGAAICMRERNDRPTRNGGWLHLLQELPTQHRRRQRQSRTFRVSVPEPSKVDFAQLAERYRQQATPSSLHALAADLDVSPESLLRLRAGWNGWAWTFPMTNAAGNVRGLRLRKTDGRKLSCRGGMEGLFVPAGLGAGRRLLICEGPTDTAAMLDLGFAAVGRPSCSGGGKLLVELVRQHEPADIVIVADRDEHKAGQRGAESLATVLICYSPTVRIVHPPPPAKDAREWKQLGAAHDDVIQTIEAASVKRLSVKKKDVEHGC